MSNLNLTQATEEAQMPDQYYVNSNPSTASCQTNGQAQNEDAAYQSKPANSMRTVYNGPYHNTAAVPLSGESNLHLVENENFTGFGFAQQYAIGNMEENKPRAVIKPIFYREFNLETGQHFFATSADNEMAKGSFKQSVNEKPKRNRTVFTEAHKNRLKEEFNLNRYLDQRRRQNIAESLGLSEKTVKVWFQNQRMKEKRDRHESVACGVCSDDDVELDISSPESTPMQLSPILPYPSTSGCQISSNYPMDQRYNLRYLPIRGSPASEGYSNVLEPVEDLSSDFDSETSFNSPCEELTSLTVNLIPNPKGENVPIETTPPDNGEGEVANCNVFSIARYMNLDD